MKYIKTYEYYKPIKINNEKPFKVIKDIDTKLRFLQKQIRGLKKRKDSGENDTKRRSEINADLSSKILKFRDLNFHKLKQIEYLKLNPVDESYTKADELWINGEWTIPDINERDPVDGSTPLINAVIECNFENVKQLIRNGADVNIQDKVGYTALMWAIVEYNDRHIIEEYDDGRTTLNDNKDHEEILKEILKTKPNLLPTLFFHPFLNFWDLAGPTCQEFMYDNSEEVRLFVDTQKYNL